jgi:hypothetical protein
VPTISRVKLVGSAPDQPRRTAIVRSARQSTRQPQQKTEGDTADGEEVPQEEGPQEQQGQSRQAAQQLNLGGDPLTKIATGVHRFRVNAESVHGGSDLGHQRQG